MKIKKLSALFIVGAFLLSLTGCAAEQPVQPTDNSIPQNQETVFSEPVPTEPSPWDMTTMEIVRDMGIGINLGNTFDAFGDWVDKWGDGSVESYVTCWGSPVITQEMIQGYADEGFGVLRIPVHWFNLMGDDYTISADYLAAVKQVVQWALDAEMYVIVNIHHDEDGLFAGFPTNREASLSAYVKIWSQLAEAFRDYDHRVVLESLNEEGCWDGVWNRWGTDAGKAEAYQILFEINQAFVDTIRGSGGNNERRHLLLAGYATGITETCDAMFRMPEDPANRCAVSVHYYTPPGFAILEEDASWGKATATWGTEADFAELEAYMNMLQATFVDNGIPVIVGEYGCPSNNKERESVRLYLSSVCAAIYERNMCPILWDVAGAHYDRNTYKMIDRELIASLIAVTQETNLP